jgi:tRNA pseudouridine38-40 synthase
MAHRYRITIEYDGTGYVGWQRQPDHRSIQQALEEAIAGFANEAVTVGGAGRTDAGVHALGQVAHFDLARLWRPDRIRDAINAYLRKQRDHIAVLLAEAVSDDFDARHSALRRHYVYRIVDRRAPLALDRLRAWNSPVALDAAAMQIAAGHLLGRHDFTTFRSAECQSESPVKTLDRLDVLRTDGGIEVHTHARSFLHHQVRSMVGSLVEVGRGVWAPTEMRRRLEAANRALCGPQAPAHGLYFLRVDYP